uniref:Uncharacterized protein n=1 Tax=Cryptosporidium parvum TaxID=5807 RepID=F0X545_CRYPV
MINSSLTELDFSTTTPGSILTVLTLFSPKKFLISIKLPLFKIFELIGKWEYTRRILYSNFFMTPTIMFLIAEQTVLIAD